MAEPGLIVVGRPQGLLAAAEAGVREEDRADWQDGRVGPEEEEENLMGTLEKVDNHLSEVKTTACSTNCAKAVFRD